MEPTSSSLLADTLCRAIDLGVTVVDAATADQVTHVWCEVLAADLRCPGCGEAGSLRDHIVRELVDLPIAGARSVLHVRVPRLICEREDCATRVYRAGTDQLAAARSKVTRRVGKWILQRLVLDRMSVKATAAVLGLSWGTVNKVALTAARELTCGPEHLAGVRELGVDEHKWKVDEHKWKHVRGNGDSSWVTVLVDLTPVRDGTGPARLLDMVAGRSAQALRDWLEERDQAFRDRIKVTAMDGFAGYHSAAGEALPQARTVMDPFHVIHLAAEKVTGCRQRLQQAICGHRGRSGDPLYGIRRILLTRPSLLTEKQQVKLDSALAADERHIAVEVTAQVYQDLIAAYEHPERRGGKIAMFKALKRIHTGLPAGLTELAQLGRSLWKRRREILAYFDTGVSNGPVEAINGRLEHLRGIALGFRNLDHYILRSLLHSGQLADRVNAL